MLLDLYVSSWFSPQIHIYLVFFGKESQDGADAQCIMMARQHSSRWHHELGHAWDTAPGMMSYRALYSLYYIIHWFNAFGEPI